MLCRSSSAGNGSAVLNVHLVVVDSMCGPGVPTEQRGKPPDRVAVYHPGDDTRAKRARSWANDVAPVLARKQAQGSLATDPEYRVIIHNGEPPAKPVGPFLTARNDRVVTFRIAANRHLVADLHRPRAAAF